MNKRSLFIGMIYFFGALGGLLFGFDTGVISGALLYITNDFQLTPFSEGLVVGGLLIGAAIGAGFCGMLSDKIGRKRSIILLGVLFTIGAWGTAFAPEVTTLVLFRVELGIAVGGASTLVPLYLSEMAPAVMRGRIAALNTVMCGIGLLSAYLVNYYYSSTGNWHYMLAWAVLPSVVLVAGMFFVPESPRWLLKNKGLQQARKVLALTRGEDMVDAEIEMIQHINKQKEGTFRELFQPSVFPIVLIGIGVAVGQQVIGTNTIFYYAPTVLAKAGSGSSSAILGTIMLGVANLIFTIVGILLVDKIGRRLPLMLGNIGMSLALVLLGVGVNFFSAPAWFLTVCLGLFMMSYSASWGMIAWIVLAEILPLRIRGRAMGVAGIIHWCSNFAVSFTFPLLLASLGIGYVYFMYAAIGIIAFLFVYKYVPETNGKTLEEIELELAQKYGPAAGEAFAATDTQACAWQEPLGKPEHVKYESTITEIGKFTLDFLKNEKKVILFNGDEVPPELVNMVVQHTESCLHESIRVGDAFTIGNQQYTVAAIGTIALHSLREKGHCTLVFSGKNKVELPGQIVLSGKLEPRFMVGDTIWCS
ncbi:hypothetical protein P22_1182 [Propionispora sp. 2/2-37]|uniref:sugar porter family MFS transporter n=1 Tax=Propionispora sp. 2/2-37 TaxID=1677858 RepID=UPI0006C1642B|nr:sugar porter family MFS transporter [Propionispora sp. 2/2-37]CUH95113.1 hypothetical protein P22_1182 [Propionispora sp. 2/2-37]